MFLNSNKRSNLLKEIWYKKVQTQKPKMKMMYKIFFINL